MVFVGFFAAIRIVGEKLPPEGIAIAVDEFDKDGIVYEKDGVKARLSRSIMSEPVSDAA